MKARYIGATQSQINWGGNDDPRPLLTIGKIYTVKRREIHSWHTKFILAEYPNKKFNSVNFEKANE